MLLRRSLAKTKIVSNAALASILTGSSAAAEQTARLYIGSTLFASATSVFQTRRLAEEGNDLSARPIFVRAKTIPDCPE